MCLLVDGGGESKLIGLHLGYNLAAPRTHIGADLVVFCLENLIMHQREDKILAGAQEIRTEIFLSKPLLTLGQVTHYCGNVLSSALEDAHQDPYPWPQLTRCW